MIGLTERLDALETVLIELRALNDQIPVVVEGRKDVAALRELGLTGELIVINEGSSLIDFCDRLAERHREAVVLTDWDRTGGSIMRHLRDNLKGRVKMHREIRRTIAVFSEVHDVESLPAYLGSLRRRVMMLTRDPRGEGSRHD